jgi:hypothetical protein
MKKIILLLVLITSINLSAQDKSYWMCYNFSVEKESEATELVEAIDMLMNADEMAQNPFTVFLFEIAFANSEAGFSHQLCFLAENADYLKGWGSGPGEFAESMLVNKIFESVATPVSSILASPLIFDPTKAGYEYSNVWSVKVTDVPKFAALAADFIEANSDNFDGTIELHEAISGAEKGVTHYMVARSNNLGDWLRGRESVFSNPKSQPWFNNSNKYSEFIDSFAGKTIKVYTSE